MNKEQEKALAYERDTLSNANQVLRDDLGRVRDTLKRCADHRETLLARVAELEKERDQYRTVLETLAAAVRNPLTTGADLYTIVCEQLEENGFDTSLDYSED